jgi:hypothetical protein
VFSVLLKWRDVDRYFQNFFYSYFYHETHFCLLVFWDILKRFIACTCITLLDGRVYVLLFLKLITKTCLYVSQIFLELVPLKTANLQYRHQASWLSSYVITQQGVLMGELSLFIATDCWFICVFLANTCIKWKHNGELVSSVLTFILRNYSMD